MVNSLLEVLEQCQISVAQGAHGRSVIHIQHAPTGEELILGTDDVGNVVEILHAGPGSVEQGFELDTKMQNFLGH